MSNRVAHQRNKMIEKRSHRWLYFALPPLVLVIAAFVLVELFLDLDEDSVDRKAAERLTLYRQTILGEYQKYRYLPYMIARDPRATSALGLGQPVESANRFLQEMSENSGAESALCDEFRRNNAGGQQLAGSVVRLSAGTMRSGPISNQRSKVRKASFSQLARRWESRGCFLRGRRRSRESRWVSRWSRLTCDRWRKPGLRAVRPCSLPTRTA